MLSEASNNPGARTMPDKTTTLYTAQNFEEGMIPKVLREGKRHANTPKHLGLWTGGLENQKICARWLQSK